MEAVKWGKQKVYGRDEVLRDIENRADAYSNTVIRDVRAVMHDYEVDMYRLVLGIAKRYGRDAAYEIMSDTVAEKRLRWLGQVQNELVLGGTEVEKGLALYLRYFRPKEGEFRVLEKTERKVVFERKDYVNAISHACCVLGIDVIEVSNKVYARAMNLMFERLNLKATHAVLKHQDGSYEEMIELQ